MSSERRNLLLKYGICIAVCALAAWLIMDPLSFGELTLSQRYNALCNGFFVPGIMCILIGLLFTVSNMGTFDGLFYVLKYAVKVFIPGGRNKMQKYFDFVRERENKHVSGFGFLYVVGGVFFVVSMVFLALFYTAI